MKGKLQNMQEFGEQYNNYGTIIIYYKINVKAHVTLCLVRVRKAVRITIVLTSEWSSILLNSEIIVHDTSVLWAWYLLSLDDIFVTLETMHIVCT